MSGFLRPLFVAGPSIVHRLHGVVAAKIAAIGHIEAAKWDVGLTSGLTLLLAAIAEVRY